MHTDRGDNWLIVDSWLPLVVKENLDININQSMYICFSGAIKTPYKITFSSTPVSYCLTSVDCGCELCSAMYSPALDECT